MLNQIEIDTICAPLGRAKNLPPKAYNSPESFRQETQEIFYKEWICVAREEQLPNSGDYRSVKIVDQPLIVVRQKDGGIKAMSSICPHRAMQVVQDDGNAGSFSCPYHLWKFGLDGSFVSAPHMDGVEDFPPAGCNLKGVNIDVWQGFIFVNLDIDAKPLETRQLNSHVGEYNMSELRIASSIDFACPWNWKILVENFMEAYHHVGPHLQSVQPTHHAKDSYVTGSVDEGWSVLHMPDAEGAADKEQALPMIEGLTSMQQSEILASLIMPTFAWLNTPSSAFWYELKPTAHDNMNLTIHTLLPRTIVESTDGEAIAALVQASIEQIHLEDISVNEGPWVGLNAPLTEQGPLSMLEESIWQMNQWWVSRIAD